MKDKRTLQDRAADALGLTHGLDSRGSKTHVARLSLAEWLDGIPRSIGRVERDVKWLEKVIDFDIL